jgi:hypothetical protein
VSQSEAERLRSGRTQECVRPRAACRRTTTYGRHDPAQHLGRAGAIEDMEKNTVCAA